MLLDIEARIGELYAAMPRQPGVRGEKVRTGKTAAIQEYGVAVERAKRLEEMQASQRATAKALGVSHVTIGKDLGRVGNKLPEQEIVTPDDGNKVPHAPSPLTDAPDVFTRASMILIFGPRPLLPALSARAGEQVR